MNFISNLKFSSRSLNFKSAPSPMDKEVLLIRKKHDLWSMFCVKGGCQRSFCWLKQAEEVLVKIKLKADKPFAICLLNQTKLDFFSFLGIEYLI